MSEEKPADRVYVKHKTNGLVGFLIEKDGVTKVKLDRPDPLAIRLYSPNDWDTMSGELKVPRMQIAFIQWAADRALLRAMGDHRAANRDWHSLTDVQRIEFMDKGPGSKHGKERRKLWEAIKEATRDLVE